ncbi:hypothetical protein K7J14_03530 [Treponema zuelzerae]|uniref:Carbohydrate kinase PfkB domain-containing protein n=1 Tax=Teretinema zuelzerae TaxID=156 RepID=A0AAE3EFL1_9SPIR|nr:PfkB family carbohydrate kinase [Teretinema zuelzerae]MCD1653769.1 hypothetical protein [Teretinema zuelzerae]
MRRILAAGLSPTLQKTIAFKNLTVDAVNRSQGYRIDASGKAVNASRVLDQLEKGCVKNLCPLGSDNADFFLELAARDGLPVVPLYTTGRVRYCYTLVEPGSGRATELVVSEPVGSDDYAALAAELLSMLKREAAEADAFVFAGSRPSFWPAGLCADLCAAAREQGLLVMADFHGPDLARTIEKAVPDIIKINEEEFCGTFGFPFPLPEPELTKAIADKSRELDSLIVITRGSKDTFAADRGELHRQKVTPVTALNAIGCGDSFTAGFLHEWLASGSVPLALAEGGRCAALNALNLRPGSIRDPGAEGETLW